MESVAKFEYFLETGPDWGRLQTSIDGVFVVKLPAGPRHNPRIAIEVRKSSPKGEYRPVFFFEQEGALIESKEKQSAYRNSPQFDKLTSIFRQVDEANRAISTRRHR